MIRLDIASLEIFVAAVDLKSLSKAAEHESVVTSAASKRVAELERQLGTRLLRRHGRGVEATPAGVALYQRAKAILRSIKLAEDEVAGFAPHGTPKVRLAASRSTVVHYLPNSLREFMRKHADTHIDLIERMSPDIPRLVVEGAADIGIYHATAAARVSCPGPRTPIASN
jgi:DNA-binding transcriptional LysR family regulator